MVAQSPGFAGWLLVLAALSLPGASLLAQGRSTSPPDLRNSSHLGVGYVVSIPHLYVGFSALGLTPKLLGGAGVYGDVKLTTSSPGSDPYYRGDISVDQAELTYGDMLFEEKSDWLSVNLALVLALSREFGVYGGAGYSKEQHYRQYYDDQKNRGLEGFYWVSDAEGSGHRINLSVGGLFRLGKYVLLQMGAATQPRGATVGIMLAFPR